MLLSITKVKAQINIQDSLALVYFYDSTGGPNWFNNTNWLTKAPVSSWKGIKVSGGRVTSIDMSGGNGFGNGLIGTIPSSIGNLTNLTYLDFTENKLSGTIPSSIGNLTNLTSLRLTSNKLSGTIPSSIGNLTKLQLLQLPYNQLSDSIPSSFVNLTNLKTLNLNVNQLSGNIPSWLGNLTNLTYLGLGANLLDDSIPSSLSNLINLTELELSSNQLSDSIPSSLGYMPNLQYLSLGGNQLTGTIPTSLGNATNLINLYLDDTQLSGTIPSSLGNLTKLVTLYLDNNQLSGSIPSCIGTLTNLRNIDFSYNQLSGAIPSSLRNLLNLINYPGPGLALNNNQFTFAGMENINSIAVYAPQAIIPLSNSNNILSVSVGGTPANDTFRWYRNDTLVALNIGDSTYTATSNGSYWAVATNALANQLTLYSDTIAVNNIVNNLPFAIFPNPAINIATIRFGQTIDNANIAVYDMAGRSVINKPINGSINTYKLNIQSLANGVYVLKINTNTSSYTDKLMVSK